MTDVRLSEQEKNAVKDCIASCFGILAHDIQVFLFGSRTRLDLNGGDIDLLVVSDDSLVEHLMRKRVDFLMELKQVIGEQKIDLIIAGKSALNQDPFLKSIWRQAQRID